MCDPTTAMLVITAATSAYSINAQQQAATYQERQNNQLYKNAMEARAANLNQTNLEMTQEREGAMQKLEQNQLKADSARATASVAAGENGVSGLSVDALMGDISANQGRYDTAVVTNYDRSMGAIESQRQNVNTNAANIIAGMRTPSMPDYASAGLRIADAGAKWYDKHPNAFSSS